MDEELTFDVGDPLRVIYNQEWSGVRTQAPDDLEPVDRAWRDRFAGEDEVAPSTFPEWPWALAAITSLPDTTAFGINARGDDRHRDYDDQLMRFRASELRRTTGLVPAQDCNWPDLGIFAETQRFREPHRLHPFEQNQFPWTSRGIALVARAILKKFARSSLAPLVEPLAQWRDRADADAKAEPVIAEEANAFIGLLNQLMRADQRRNPRTDGAEATIYQDGIKRAIEVAVHRLITETGADPALAAAIPDTLYRNAYPRHAPIIERSSGQLVQHAQLLGFVPSSQEPLPVDSPLLTLLQLPTDRGIDLILGDMGEIDIQIEKGALAARRWDLVRGWHVGG